MWASATRIVNVVDTTAPTIDSPSLLQLLKIKHQLEQWKLQTARSYIHCIWYRYYRYRLQNGVLSFVTAPDFETQTTYTATVTVTDASGNSTTQDIT